MRCTSSVVGSLPTFPIGSTVLSAFACQPFNYPLLVFSEVSCHIAKSMRLLQQRAHKLRNLSKDMHSSRDSNNWVVCVHPRSTHLRLVSSVFMCPYYALSLMLPCVTFEFGGMLPRVVNRGQWFSVHEWFESLALFFFFLRGLFSSFYPFQKIFLYVSLSCRCYSSILMF